MRLYMIRHGDPDYPEDRLSDLGHSQARAVAESLASAPPRHLFASPMHRARQTAAYSAERLGLEVGIEPWMAEREGWVLADPRAGGAPVWQLDAAQARDRGRIPAGSSPPMRQLPEAEEPGLEGEIIELGRGSDEFLARQGCHREGSRYDLESSAGDVAAFCHCGFALTWLAHLLELPLALVWAGFTLRPGSVTTVVFEESSSGGWTPRCPAVGETGHLAALVPS